MRLLLCVLCVLCGSIFVSFAQDAQPTPTDVPLVYGLQVSGTLNSATPRTVYYFDGLRGEVVTVTLDATHGDLDPVLIVLRSSGSVIASRDDGTGNRDIRIESLRIPQSDRYYLVVGRFGYGLGTTQGDYQLTVERIGVSSASGSALRYGDSVINNITDKAPEVYYSFRAQQGDIVDIQMQRVSGDLDAYLQVVDSNAFVIAEDDDVQGSGSLDAAIPNLVIQNTGTYVIIASRFGEAAGNSTGGFVLTLSQTTDSGLGNAPQVAIPIEAGQTVEGELTANHFSQYYTFRAHQNDIVTIRMDRADGSLDAFLALADANQLEIVTDDDSGGGQNAAINAFLIPADGTYTIIATRYQRGDGNTAGHYRLQFSTQGNAFQGVPAGLPQITYGTTITGSITNDAPQKMVVFWGVAGDVITISMSRSDGDLDPFLRLLDSNQNSLVSDDDSGGGQNARIDKYTLPQTGVYYIQAGRYSGTTGNPNTQGSFILVLARRFN